MTGVLLRAGLVVAAVTATAAIAGTGATSAQAATAPAAANAARCHHPCSNPPPGGGWRYVDNYFWASSCIGAGNRGIDNRLWARYECYGSTWTNYDLWVHT
ncbi:MAG TPA: hypothetical protein VF069_28425 [Streptosporangiaceae bacterium]